MMVKHLGFMIHKRQEPEKRSIHERIHDFKEFERKLSDEQLHQQANRCMDCGIPFCHAYGCPTKNLIPDWNDMIYKGQWRHALDLLHSTINFPEFTGRVCPAPCESSCTLALNQEPVTIRHIELQIIEHGWKAGFIQPEIAPYKTGKKVAIIGSGPAGLAAAQQLIRKGHRVVVFEKNNRVGGILRYGIPDFKLEKWVIDRRLEQMRKEGVKFETEVKAGYDISVRYIQRTFDAVLITCGSTIPRDLNIPGRELPGIHFAMDFLTQQNKKIAGDKFTENEQILATGKHVVVIGGGDTGSDCVGTSRRQGAKEITQIELLPEPPRSRNIANPWPTWPDILKTSSSQEEGCQRMWSILTKQFSGDDTGVKKIKGVQLKWNSSDNGRSAFSEIPGTDFELKTDLVLLAMGFVQPEISSLIEDFDIELHKKNTIKIDSNYMTSVPGIFAAGDCVMGASLIVKAIYQGRQAAAGVNEFLKTA